MIGSMLPVLEGVIARRVLLNFRADLATVQKLLPSPFVAESNCGWAMVGVCLIRLEQLRPRGFPALLGLSSENMAHRVAVLYPVGREVRRGVFIWRRETDQKLVQLFGGRLFPGVHYRAGFSAREDNSGLRMEVTADDGVTDVAFSASEARQWPSTSVFPSLEDASEFYRGGECGFSSGRGRVSLEGMRLKTVQWSPQPLTVELRKASFFFDNARFPKGSLDYDCALIMRRVPHEWHEVDDIPALQLPELRNSAA